MSAFPFWLLLYDRAAFGSLFLSDGRNGLARGLCFQKFPNWSWHGPRPHINRVGPIETSNQVPSQIAQIGIEDGADLLPLFAIAKNLAVANYSENLAAVRIDDIALEHGFLFCRLTRRLQLRSRRVVPVPCYCPQMPQNGARNAGIAGMLRSGIVAARP